MAVAYKVYCPVCCRGIVRSLSMDLVKNFRFHCRDCQTNFYVEAKSLADSATRIKGREEVRDRTEGDQKLCASK